MSIFGELYRNSVCAHKEQCRGARTHQCKLAGRAAQPANHTQEKLCVLPLFCPTYGAEMSTLHFLIHHWEPLFRYFFTFNFIYLFISVNEVKSWKHWPQTLNPHFLRVKTLLSTFFPGASLLPVSCQLSCLAVFLAEETWAPAPFNV